MMINVLWRKKLLLLVVLQLAVYSLFAQENGKAKNIILMIGDGMGFAQISAAYYSNGDKLHMLQLPVSGVMSTHAYDDLVTDSGAGGTAISTGIKTYNGAIGVNQDTIPVVSILELLRDKGKKTGLVVTCGLTHATPAAFYAHQPSRKLDEAIAADFLLSGIDIAIGGGRAFFEKRKTDSRNLIQELKLKNIEVNSLDPQSPSFPEIKTQDKLVLFTADKDPGKKSQKRNYLPHATGYALEFLNTKAESGFFIMVEGSQIDWGGHANDTDYILGETLDFDQAVEQAINFAKRDGNTLVIVMADHETGGMALNQNEKQQRFKAAYTTKDHTAVFVPVFAYGPGAELFSGFYDNTTIKAKILQAAGF